MRFKCLKCGNPSVCSSKFAMQYRVARGLTPCLSCLPEHSAVSGEELKVREFISSLIPEGELVSNDRSLLSGTELDMYIPTLRLAIEYDGLYWRSSKFVPDRYHADKSAECESAGIRLIHIFSDEWIEKSEIVKSRLRSLLGVSAKIYARRCTVVELTDKHRVAEFLESNHIQGSCGCSVAFGLIYNTELVAVMTFGQSRFNPAEFELLRYCSKLNVSVTGGAGKLLAAFHKAHPEISEVVSYADRRWSSGNVYKKLGFTLESVSKPSYFYTKGSYRENRMKFQKLKLIQRHGFSADLTELEMASSLGYYRVYDCGQLKFKLRFTEAPRET